MSLGYAYAYVFSFLSLSLSLISFPNAENCRQQTFTSSYLLPHEINLANPRTFVRMYFRQLTTCRSGLSHKEGFLVKKGHRRYAVSAFPNPPTRRALDIHHTHILAREISNTRLSGGSVGGHEDPRLLSLRSSLCRSASGPSAGSERSM